MKAPLKCRTLHGYVFEGIAVRCLEISMKHVMLSWGLWGSSALPSTQTHKWPNGHYCTREIITLFHLFLCWNYINAWTLSYLCLLFVWHSDSNWMNFIFIVYILTYCRLYLCAWYYNRNVLQIVSTLNCYTVHLLV